MAYIVAACKRSGATFQLRILRRQLIHVSGFSVRLIFRRLLGAGTLRECNNLRDGQFAPVDVVELSGAASAALPKPQHPISALSRWHIDACSLLKIASQKPA